jgi:DegV family protein with EDD domain
MSRWRAAAAAPHLDGWHAGHVRWGVSAHARPRIRYLDGARFRRALIAGARQLFEHRDRLNAINVFPVADADTGTNMAGTLTAVVDGIRALGERAIDAVLRAVADLALEGARGCSGTILAQLFHGLAKEFAGNARLSVLDFGIGVQKAVVYPWEAVSQPREGTILTVLSDWGRAVREWSERTDDFVELLTHAFEVARRSLAGTQEQLDVLSKAGVVDAGAQGLVHLLGGVTSFIATGRIREVEQFVPINSGNEHVTSDALDCPAFRYCTQFVVEGADIDAAGMRKELAHLGDSVIVAGSPARAKIHLHSNAPAQAYRRMDRHGRIVSQRIEDMTAQYRAVHAAHRDIALVVDSACDLPPEAWERHNIHVVPCILVFDGRTYLDKLTVTPDILFSLLRATRRGHPTTSQPPAGDFRSRYEFLLTHYRSVISLSLSASISGTFDSARAGAKLAGKDVTVIDSRSASIGLGLIVRRAAEAIEHGEGREEVLRLVHRLVPRTRIHFAVRSLDGLVRSGRVSKVKGLAARLLGLKPLLRLGADTGGKPVQGATVFGVKGGRKRILRILHGEIDKALPVEFAIAHANAYKDALWFKQRLAEEFTLAREPFVVEATSVLAAHIGEGTVGIAYILPGDDD